MLYFKKYPHIPDPQRGGVSDPPPPAEWAKWVPYFVGIETPKATRHKWVSQTPGFGPSPLWDPTERPPRDTSAGGRREQDEFERRKKDAEKKGELLEEPVKAAEEEVVGRAEPPGRPCGGGPG